MYKHIVILAALGYAAYQWDKRRRDRNDPDHDGIPGVKHEDVHNWEGEGGALHGSGPQLGPEPALP